MTVAGAPITRAPTPEECDHPAPVEGVMAHEFAHYEGARGPEGKRRTVTYYGPVIGGLPIQAWHCEVCGLLRLTFPDGRKEERHLFPGPQPGLLAEAAAVAPERELYGLQARVSGLSAQPAYIDRLVAESPFTVSAPPLQLPRIVLPEWDVVTWVTVLALAAIGLLLLVMAVEAIYTYSTPGVEAPLAVIVALTFAGVLVFRTGAAAIRHFFPMQPLAPSVAERLREKPALDGATRAAVTFLVVAVVALFGAGLLAIYTYSTPGAELPVLLLGLVSAILAAVIKLVSAAWRHFGPH